MDTHQQFQKSQVHLLFLQEKYPVTATRVNLASIKTNSFECRFRLFGIHISLCLSLGTTCYLHAQQLYVHSTCALLMCVSALIYDHKDDTESEVHDHTLHDNASEVYTATDKRAHTQEKDKYKIGLQFPHCML